MKTIGELGGMRLAGPLRPCGEAAEGIETYWLGRADILGASFHVELHQVHWNGDEQESVGRAYDKYDDLVNLAGDGNFETVTVDGREYLLILFPFCR
jgi:hypothetical protein